MTDLISKMFHCDAQLYATVKLAAYVEDIPEEEILKRLNNKPEFLVLLDKRLKMQEELLHYMLVRLSSSASAAPIWNYLIASDKLIVEHVKAVIEEIKQEIIRPDRITQDRL